MVRVLGAVAGAVVLVLASTPASAAPNDPLFERQWALRTIRSVESWPASQGEGVTIAIVDTGVNDAHPDLAANIGPVQYDAINDDGDALDLRGHGTLVAGAAAAVANNGIGIAGAAPRATIMPVRAFSDVGPAAVTDVADAIMWAADNGADVINLSLGSGFPVDVGVVETVAIAYATAQGSLVVAAAGNDGAPFCSSPGSNPLVLCVGATDALDRLAPFSNYALRLDVVAPGTAIWSTNMDGSYSFTQGTSLAAPLVSGVAAQLMSMGASNVLASLILRTSAKDLGLPAYDITYGFGRLDAKAAVDMCSELCTLGL